MCRWTERGRDIGSGEWEHHGLVPLSCVPAAACFAARGVWGPYSHGGGGGNTYRALLHAWYARAAALSDSEEEEEGCMGGGGGAAPMTNQLSALTQHAC